MKDKYFLDTNIIVFAHDCLYPEKQQISQELIFSGMRNSTAVISAQVLGEFFVTVTKKIKDKYSTQAARHEIMLLSSLEIADIDYDIVIRAVSFHSEFKISYWDGLILASAERSDCKVLYSEDLSHNQNYSGIVCINPYLSASQ